jgi:hypothetical protein
MHTIRIWHFFCFGRNIVSPNVLILTSSHLLTQDEKVFLNAAAKSEDAIISGTVIITLIAIWHS